MSDDAFRSKFPSGSVLGSPLSFRHAGATGPWTDQKPSCAALGVAELEDETARVVRAQIMADMQQPARPISDLYTGPL